MIYRKYHSLRFFLSLSQYKYRKNYFSSEAASEWANCEARVFSGIQPTGIPHLGNYVGAISNWLKLQKKYSGNILLSIVDLHSITIYQQKEQLRQNILDMTACLLACGIDPSQTVIFQQSMVPYHTELAWILSCLCTIPRIQRLAQWKEKQSKIKEPSVGLLTYPILQAADIMLYKSTLVPVGEDQVQHIELTRDLTRNFNRIHGVLFPECKILTGEIAKIRSLRNPANKMSKSDPNEKSRIDLTDSPEAIKLKLRKAVTDFTSQISYDPENRPGISNLIDIQTALNDMSHDEVVEESFLKAEDSSMFKERLADIIIDKLSPIRTEIIRLQADPGYLLNILKSGSERASIIAESTVKDVRQLVGLR